MRKVKFVLMFILLTLLLTMTLLPSASILASRQGPTQIAETEWLTYTDPHYGFSIQYPANWYVNPRNDSGGVGATLSFSNVDFLAKQADQDRSISPSTEKTIKVEIGVYLVEWTADVSLEE